MLNRHVSAAILLHLTQHNATISDFLLSAIYDPHFRDHPLVTGFLSDTINILGSLYEHPAVHRDILDWSLDLVKKDHAKSLQTLSSKKGGWHFSALRARVAPIREFRIEDMACKIESTAPNLWNTILSLLSADPRQVRRRKSQNSSMGSIDTNPEAEVEAESDAEDDDEAQFWLGADDEAGQPDEASGQRTLPRLKTAEQRAAILRLVRVPSQMFTEGYNYSPTESDMHHQHNDAQHEPEMQLDAERDGRLFPFLQHSAEGHPDFRSHGMLDLTQFHQHCHQISLGGDVEDTPCDGSESQCELHVRQLRHRLSNRPSDR